MLKKSITYKDWDGAERTEDFYFNIGKAELAELELGEKGGLSERLKEVIAAEDGGQIMATFRKIIEMAVGMRSEDGRRFVKNDDVRADFLQTGAYDVLFMELVTDATKGAEFIKGIVPSDLAAQIEDMELPGDPKKISEEDVPAWLREKREPTSAELTTMSREELAHAFKMREQWRHENRASQ